MRFLLLALAGLVAVVAVKVARLPAPRVLVGPRVLVVPDEVPWLLEFEEGVVAPNVTWSPRPYRVVAPPTLH